MSKSVIVTCAVTGGIHTPTMSPYLPVKPADIAKAALEAVEAGATIIHLHARHPETGKPDHRPETFQQILPIIKDGCDAVINISTGAGLGMNREQRILAAKTFSSEMASLNLGSMNFGIFPLAAKYTDWQHDWEPAFLNMTEDFIFRNTFTDIEFILKELGENQGTRFEFECYDLGHLYNLAYLVDKGSVKPPFFIQMIFGILGGMGPDLENLTFMKMTAERLFGRENFQWSVLAAGRHQMPFLTQAALMGGNVRVGLEDSLFISRGELATSNAQQVEKIVRIIREMGREPATPDEARAMLGLKGGDRVEF